MASNAVVRSMRLETEGRTVLLSADQIRHVLGNRSLLSVPLARKSVAGLLLHEGQAIPVYRLSALRIPGARQRSGAGAPPSQGSEIVVVEAGGAIAGFLVDRAELVDASALGEGATTGALALLSAAGVVTPGSQAGLAAAGGE